MHSDSDVIVTVGIFSVCCGISLCYGLFPLPESDSDSDSCTMQKFSTGSDPDSDPLIEIY